MENAGMGRKTPFMDGHYLTSAPLPVNPIHRGIKPTLNPSKHGRKPPPRLIQAMAADIPKIP
jgi:hypothetical protein